MRIVKFIIENYKALKGHHEFNPAGANFMLIGTNGSGKTSAGRALMDVLTKNVPSKPITTGENSGYVEYTFDNGQRILGRFSENGTTKVELLSPEGLKINTPKELIQQLTGDAMQFSIDEFMSMQPKLRRALLEKIAGLDLSDLNAAEKELEERRRNASAAAKAAEARAKPYKEALALLPDVNTSETVETIRQMTEANAAYERVANGLNVRRTKVEELKAEMQKISDEIAKGEEWLNSARRWEEQEIQQQQILIEQADAIREAKRLKADHDEYKKLRDEAKAVDDEIHSIRAQKEQIIKTASLPADGLRFEGDDILIDDLPFEDAQIAASRKLIAAIQIAASMLGQIRYLHFDGAALDKSSADKILMWAEKNDLQLCLERPLWEGGDGVKLEIIEAVDTVETPAKKTKESKKEQKTDIAEQISAPVTQEASVAEQKNPFGEPKKAQLPW